MRAFVQTHAARLVLIVTAIGFIVAGVLLWNQDSNLVNVGFLLLGGMLTVLTTLASDEAKKQQHHARKLARALHIELADRVARCCHDFEDPWSKYVGGAFPKPMGRFRLLKFEPLRPVIYHLVAGELAVLPGDIPLLLVRFYFRLDAWRRDITNTPGEWDPQSGPPASVTTPLATRVYQTLNPGLEALRALGALAT